MLVWSRKPEEALLCHRVYPFLVSLPQRDNRSQLEVVVLVGKPPDFRRAIRLPPNEVLWIARCLIWACTSFCRVLAWKDWVSHPTPCFGHHSKSFRECLPTHCCWFFDLYSVGSSKNPNYEIKNIKSFYHVPPQSYHLWSSPQWIYLCCWIASFKWPIPGMLRPPCVCGHAAAMGRCCHQTCTVGMFGMEL